MKKLTVLIILLFSVMTYVPSQAQSEPEMILDSTLQVRYNPETGTMENYFKEFFAYDSLGNETFYREYLWEAKTGSWTEYIRKDYTYDAMGNRTSFVYYRWIEEEQYWEGHSFSETSYNENGEQIRYTSYEWDQENREWVYRMQFNYELNNNGDIIINEILRWDVETEAWVGNLNLANRSDYQFDENHNTTQAIFYEWDTLSGDWMYRLKDEYAYNAEGKDTLYKSYTWDPEAADWVKRFRNDIAYDSLGNILEEVRYGLDTLTGEWTVTQKGVYTYTPFEDTVLITLYERSDWLPDSSVWWTWEQSKYAYDSLGHLLEQSHSYFDEDADTLKPYIIFEYAYNAAGLRVQEIRLRMDRQTGELMNDEKLVSGYDTNNNEILRASYRWNPDLGSWEGERKEERIIDAFSQTEIRYEWDEDAQDWVALEKRVEVALSNDDSYRRLYYELNDSTGLWEGYFGHESVCDAFGNRLFETDFFGDETKNDWRVNRKREFEYDYSCPAEKAIVSSEYAYYNNIHILTQINEYRWDPLINQAPLYSSLTLYYSSTGGTSARELTEPTLVVYPNPAIHTLFVDITEATATLDIFTLTGKKVISEKLLQGRNEVNISGLQPGMFLYTLNQGGTYHQGKFIRSR